MPQRYINQQNLRRKAIIDQNLKVKGPRYTLNRVFNGSKPTSPIMPRGIGYDIIGITNRVGL